MYFFSVSDTGTRGKGKSEFSQQKSNCDREERPQLPQICRETDRLEYFPIPQCIGVGRSGKSGEVGEILRNSTDT